MEWIDTALVIRVGKFKEADQWVRLLTVNRGLVTAFAFGGSRSRKRFAGCLDLFNLLEVMAATSKTGSYLNLVETSLLEGPDRLRRDWQRQGLAMNCIRFLEKLGQSLDNSQATFNLTRQLFSLLENSEQYPALTSILFRFRLASEQGFRLDLANCARCGEPLAWHKNVALQVSRGKALCGKCAGQKAKYLYLDQEALDVLSKVQEYSPELWSDFQLSPEQWRKVSRLIDAFISYHLDHNPDSPGNL